MKKETKQDGNIVSDINSFDQEASIYKILFQDKATSLLKHVIDKITIDRYEQVNFKLPSILIAGKEGKQLIAQAFSNSMCYDFEVIQGEGLGMGGSSGSLLENSDHEIVYYINQADKLTRYSKSQFFRLLTCRAVKFQNHFGGEDLTVTADNKLFIFGINDPKRISHDLYKAIDYHCSLKRYSTPELEILVEMRLKWAWVNFEKEVPAIIVHNSQGSISNCVRLLSLAYLVMRGNNNNMITVKDVEIGIGLYKQVGINPPAIPDDIPY
jgi:hypothetical protein